MRSETTGYRAVRVVHRAPLAALSLLLFLIPSVKALDGGSQLPWIVPPEVLSWSAKAEISTNGSPAGTYSVFVTGTGSSRKSETVPTGSAPWMSSFDLGLGAILDNPDDYTSETMGLLSGLEVTALKSRDLPELSCLLYSDPSSRALAKARVESFGEELLTVEIEYDEISGFRVPSAILGVLRLEGAAREYRVSLGSHSVDGGQADLQGSQRHSGDSGLSSSGTGTSRISFRGGAARSGIDSRGGSEADKLFKRALTYLDNGAPDLALEAYTQAAVADPEVLSRESRGLRDSLKARCERILKVNATSVESYFILGAISAITGVSDQAVSYLETAARLDTSNTYANRIRDLTALSRQGAVSNRPIRSTEDGIAAFSPEPERVSVITENSGSLSNTGLIRFSVSGRVDGNSYARVTLESYGGDFKRSAETLEGSFRFRNIPPGIYRVYPEVGEKRVEPDGTVTVTDGILSYESQEIEVLDGDLEGLTLYRTQ